MNTVRMSSIRCDFALRAGIARLVIAAALTFQVILFARFVAIAVVAVRSPFERDYGEGIVWQQLRMIFDGRGYGPIDGFPAIVFHYPPVFHFATRGLALATSQNDLTAGRLVSLCSALLSAGLIGLLSMHLCRKNDSRAVSTFCGIFAALTVITLTIVQTWALLMRVDMLAISLSLAGVAFGVLAINRPLLIHAAAICFVAALYTKQTSIAAPAAVFTTLLLVRPRTALRGIATTIAAGLGSLATLYVWTDGRVLEHLFLYNINRFNPASLLLIPNWIAAQFLFFFMVALGLARIISDLRLSYRDCATWTQRQRKLARDPRAIAACIILNYFLIKTLMLALMAKSGANLNYMIEWMLAGAIMIGPAMSGTFALAVGHSDRKHWPLDLIGPIALGLPAFFIGVVPMLIQSAPTQRRPDVAEFRQLESMIRSAPRPVISDDMVVLLRNGKEVVWEPAIFAELASVGLWNQRPLEDLIRNNYFSFFITEGDRGSRDFDDRYTDGIYQAMRETYPVKCRLAGYVIHLPSAHHRGQAAPSARCPSQFNPSST